MDNRELSRSPSPNPGFYYGYVVASATFIIMLIFGGTRFAFGVFFKPVMNEFGWTRAMTSGAFSISWIVQGIMGTIFGALNDRFGPRVVMTLCGIFMGLGYLLMSQIGNLWQLYLFYGVIIGIGSSIYVPLVSTVARWFKSRRSMMTGIVVSGAGVGQLISPPIANWLITRNDWRMSYVILGGSVLIIMLLVAQFLKRDSTQFGGKPDHGNESSEHGHNSAIEGFTVREALYSRQFWLLMFIFFCPGFCAWAINIHIVPYATDLGISPAQAANILALIGGLVIAGRIAWGIVGDKIGNERTYFIGLFIMSAALFWLVTAKNTWMLYFFAPIFGFAWGSSVLASPLTAGIFGLSAHGAITGLANIGYNLGGALGPFLSGYIFDITGTYRQTFLINAFVGVLGLILIILLTRSKDNRRENIIS